MPPPVTATATSSEDGLQIAAEGPSLDTPTIKKKKYVERQRKSIVRIDPSQIVRDVLTSTVLKDISMTDIEVEVSHVRVVRESDDYTARPENAEEPVRASTVNARVSDHLGWTPQPLPTPPPVSALSLKDMRPPAFHALDGKPESVPVPTTTRDLTAEWCTLAFRLRGFLGADEAVLKVSTKPLGAGEGEFSELVLLNIEEVRGPASKLPRHLVAKFSPPFMSAVEMKFVFGSECHFYNDFTVEHGGLVRPEAIYVGHLKRGSCGTPLYCIIMESGNPPTKPTRSFKRVDGCDSIEHMLLALKTLAKFHARWWGCSNRGAKASNPLKPFLHPDHFGGFLPFLPRCIPHTAAVMLVKNGLKMLPHCFADLPQYAGAPKFGEQYALFLSTIRPLARRRRHAIIRELFRPPLTLCHGDAHLENVFFGEQYPGGCAFIDFGLTMFGNALSDVSTIVAGGLTVEARRAHEENLVRQYHACLVEFGVEHYDFQRCWDDYRFQMLLPLVRLLTMAPGLAKDRKMRRGMFAEHLDSAQRKLAEMYKQMNTRYATALMDLKFPELVAQLEITSPPCCRPCC